jgi:hypothetical protein
MYVDMLENYAFPQCEKRGNITFQQDGVTPNIGNNVRQSLNAYS